MRIYRDGTIALMIVSVYLLSTMVYEGIKIISYHRQNAQGHVQVDFYIYRTIVHNPSHIKVYENEYLFFFYFSIWKIYL